MNEQETTDRNHIRGRSSLIDLEWKNAAIGML